MKNHILCIFVFLLKCWIIQSSNCDTITYAEYVSYTQKYPEVILYNHSPLLTKYHGELGEEDSCLIAFLKEKKIGGKTRLLILQNIDNPSDDSYISYCQELISDTTKVFVYSRMYNAPFILYEKPNGYRIIATLGYVTVPLYIIDVVGEWLCVQFIYAHKKYLGWIPITECCANPYTTCN